MTDSELKRAVETVLHGEVRLRGRNIRVAVEEGRVDLVGEVPDVAEKRLAANLVRQLREVGEVRDKLRLPTARELTDKQIGQHILDAFAQDRALYRRRFDARALDGVVTLTGRTDNLEEKRLAGVLAWWVPGVADVDNQIVVDPEQYGDDGDLVDSIRQVFDKDVLIEADRIGVMVQDGHVTLVGTARSEEERQAAEHDCYYVWGVRSVENRMGVTAV